VNKPVLFTFHKIRDQGEQGSADAWRAFLDFYSPAFLRLLEINGALRHQDASAALKSMLAELTANDLARFRATSRESEREFLGDIRALLLEVALASAAPSNAQTNAAFETDKISQLLADLPLLHKEMLFFKLAGYTDATIERLLRISPRVAEKAFESLTNEYGAALRTQRDCCPWPVEWLEFLKQARTLKTESCVPAHQCVRIHDGQVSWYEKEPVEKHVSGCLRCLEAWTGLREVGYWRHAAEQLSRSEVEQLLQIIPLEKPPAKKKSLLQRLRS
jgi:hypothetical protein